MKKDKSLNKSNFKEFAQEIIRAYEEKGLVIDALLWSQVIGYYNDELAQKAAKSA